MRNDQLTDQFPQPKIDIISINKPYYIYYSHSIGYYNTQQEENDIKFLNSKKCKIINPNGLRLGKDIFQYLFKIKDCDAVWYRGNTIGVAFEVLSALAMHKPVYSLESKQIISSYEITNFVNIFWNRYYIKDDLSLFEKIFPEYYSDFLSLLSGEMP